VIIVDPLLVADPLELPALCIIYNISSWAKLSRCFILFILCPNQVIYDDMIRSINLGIRSQLVTPDFRNSKMYNLKRTVAYFVHCSNNK
jgi:hypothetical protein